MTHNYKALAPEITVFERGWLSSNNILFVGQRSGSALVDTGYCTHSAQTLALVQSALGERPLERILNTHLHSDHCGGNAALQQAWPGVQTAIPPGQAAHVRTWDAYALSYTPTGQDCPRFKADTALQPGTTVPLAGRDWQVHAAPGHDPHSVVLFQPDHRLLISADALWENGFGVVFPELEGDRAFAEVAAPLDVIEKLPLPDAMAFQLTLARDLHPTVYRHSLRAMWTMAWLASHPLGKRFELSEAAAVGLLHDIGMLHLDPLLLDP